MAERLRQLALDFPVLDRDPAKTHVPASCQEAARAALSAWREWPGGVLVLVGTEGSGKTHLATLWMRAAAARLLDLSSAEGEDAGPALAEDLDRGVSERSLLALLDAARSGRLGPVLITARTDPAEWPIGLPDLRSRLAAAPLARIADPTDADLGAVFAKHLGDRGAEAPQSLVDYVVRRIERSFAAAERTSQVLDRIALERKQRITRKLAAEVLGDEDEGEAGADPATAAGEDQ